MKRVSFELDIPEFITAEDVQEWLEFQLGQRAILDESNPLFNTELQGKASKIFVVDGPSK
jgi:hypothetical protein